MVDIIIVGAGVIGAFIARSLAKFDFKVLVIEKENDVGNVTSMANSAIVHAGYDPIPGSLKARLNVLGCKMYEQVCEELDVHFKRIGSVVVANEENIDKLYELKKRAWENKVDVKLLNREELLKMEPNLADDVFLGLFAPQAGIVDPFNLVVHAMENAIDNGVELHLNEIVEKIDILNEYYIVHTNKSKYETKFVINASGVNADTINEMVNKKSFTIFSRKGEYFVVDHFNDDYLNHTIFPLPSKKGKGILMTPTSSHNYLIGPSSEYCDYKDEVYTDIGTLNNISEQVKLLMKNVPFQHVIRTFSGIRPTSDKDDFIIEMPRFGFINVAGIESPGLASAPAIGEYVVNEFILKSFPNYKVNTHFNPNVKKYIIPRELDIKKRNEAIKKNPNFGRIVCFCEQVTLAEVEDALSRSCPPRSVKGLKKRVRAGFGKCQGGMCQTTIIKTLAQKYDVDMCDVPYDQEKTEIARFKTKVGD